MKIKKLLSLAFLGVLTLGLGISTSNVEENNPKLNAPVLNAVTATTTNTRDIYLNYQTTGLARKYANVDFTINEVSFHSENVRKYYGNRLSMRAETGSNNTGCIYNTVATPGQIKSIKILFNEKYGKNNAPYDYSTTKVYSSTTSNNVDAANLIEYKKDGWLFTYDLPADKSNNFVTIKAGEITTNIDMIVIQMEDAVMSEAETLATILNKKLDEYCGIKSIDSKVWGEIKTEINKATPEVKQALTDTIINDLFFEGKDALQATEVQHFAQRHDYIVSTHGFENLLGRKVASSNNAIFNINNDTNATILITTLGLASAILLTSFILVKNRKKSY